MCRVDPAELFGCPTEKKEATTKLRMPAFLNSEAKGCDYIVLWLDCDKEGENICFEVIEAVEKSMNLHVINNQFPQVVFNYDLAVLVFDNPSPPGSMSPL